MDTKKKVTGQILVSMSLEPVAVEEDDLPDSDDCELLEEVDESISFGFTGFEEALK